MQLGRVVGTAISTVKHASLAGWKLLVVQPYAADGKTPDADPLLAIDAIGAGNGMLVVLTSDGPAARALLGSEDSPVRYSVIGIADP